MTRLWIGFLIFMGTPFPLLGQAADFPSSPEIEPAVPNAVDGPVLPFRQQHWPGAMVIAILGVFLSAAVIGPIVRANMPADIEDFTPSPEVRPPGTP